MTNKNRLHVILTFGGRSNEHNVSVVSASNVIQHFDPEKYNLKLLYITKEGQWILCDKSKFKTKCDFSEQILPTITGVPVFFPMGKGDLGHLITQDTGEHVKVDLVYSVLTGHNGAGGIMQGFWQTARIPCAGPSLVSGAIGYDKDIMKRLLSDAGLPIGKYMVIRHHEYTPLYLDKIKKNFKFPFFIKPANSGSSLGVYKIYSESDFEKAALDVFSIDSKLIVEEYIDGSELEVYCFASGNEVKTSIIRQTIIGAKHDFYTYEAKYGADNDTTNIKNIPADIPKDDYEKVKKLAIQTYKVLEGSGEARLDLFYSKDKKIYINEINTAPSLMSEISQPSLWAGCGITHGEIIDALISSSMK
ncbi:MAG: D-alanine--D-alanine ligase [Desulfobacteraceae bacterium]|nr:D-alanine--D-alanine ligase [Desulfobacteraceae bacterium]